MRKILLTLILILLFTITALSQKKEQLLTPQIGYSLSMGMIGVDYQFGRISIGAGYLPTSSPCSDKYISSYSGNVTWCNYGYKKSGYYISAAFASAGYHGDTVDECMGVDNVDKVSPMGLINVGYKMQWDSGFNVKTEIGYGVSQIKNVVTIGVAIGYTFKLN